jgi:single-strand DNA-binding protein
MNSVSIIGNLTRAVELKTFGETTVANLSLAISERAKKGNEWIDKPVFVEVTVFGKQATNCGNFLSQGNKIGVTGKLDFQTWDDKETGKKRSKLTVVAHTVDFLTPKTGSVSNSIGHDEDGPF